MPRNGSGAYTLSDTIASATLADANELQAILDDIATALDASICEDGQTVFTAAQAFVSGTASAPGIGFVGDLDSGLYRIAANNLGVSVNAAKVLDIGTAGLTVVGTVTNTNGLLPFPSGTRMLFQQTAAPTGWTKDFNNHDKALRLVNGTVTTGGTSQFSSTFAARTINQNNLPNVGFTITATAAVNPTMRTRAVVATAGSVPVFTDAANETAQSAFQTAVNASGTPYTVTGTAASGGSGTTMDFAVLYVDVIIAVKD